ncbi:MAG TPA: hypothetical protein VGF34_03540 [Stellaceae bacterium]|jgi:Ca2+-binding RTX toxin-like protein
MAVRHWLDTNDNWTNAADWTGGVVPGSGDTAVIDAPGSYTVSEDATSTATIAVRAITISNAGAALEITDVAGNLVGAGGIGNSGRLALVGTATLTVAGAVTNHGILSLDTLSGDGGGALTVGGTLDNREVVQVGSVANNLGAPTVVTLGGLVNRAGTAFLVLGSASHQATLRFSGNGAGFTDNAGSFTLANTAPLTLSSDFANSGTFTLGGTAALTVTGDYTNSGTLDLEIGSGDGGGRLTIGGALVNTGVVQVGPNDASLSAPTTATLGRLDNRAGGNLQVFGSASQEATMTVAGAANNAGRIGIDRFATLEVTGGNAFTQTAGRTTLKGTLSAATIDIEGGVFAVDTKSFTNSGNMVAGNGGKIDFSTGGLTNLSGTTLNGGSFEVDAKGILQLPNNARVATLAADLTLSGKGSVVRSLDTTAKAQVAIETTLTTIAAGGSLAVLGGRTYTTNNSLSDAGSLEIGPGSTLNAASLSVAAGGALKVDAGARLSLASSLSFTGTVTNAGTINGAVKMAAGAGRLILDPAGTFGGKVVGGGKGSTLELASGSAAGTLKVLGIDFTNIGTIKVAAGASWTIDALAAALAGTTIKGNGGANTLTLTSAGAATLTGVSGVPTINLAARGNRVTLGDATLGGGPVTIVATGSGNNSIDASRDTKASAGQTLTYLAKTGIDKFAGGFENDLVKASAAAVGHDTLTGGSGGNTLDLTSAGTVKLARVSKFGVVNLASGNNTVSVFDNTLSGGAVTIKARANGSNKIDASEVSKASAGATLTYLPGGGIDSFIGGFEKDVLKLNAAAASRDTLDGGGGKNQLNLTSAGKVDLARTSRFGAVSLAAGTNTVTVFDNTLRGGVVTITGGATGSNRIDASGDTEKSKTSTLRYLTPSGSGSFTGHFENDVVDISSDTKASTGKTFVFTAGSGISNFTGHFENDLVKVSAAAVTADTLTGGSGKNRLTLTTAGNFSLVGVGNFAAIGLAAGNNIVALGDKTLSGRPVTITAGATGNDSIDASRDTAASKGKTLTYRAGSGTETFTGGFENDVVKISAAAVGRATLTGGSGSNTLDLTSAGIVKLAGVENFASIKLEAGNNTVTLADKTLAGAPVTITAGASGTNNVSATGDTAKSKGKTLTYLVGGGTDKFTGGFENDVLKATAAAVSRAAFTGGSGKNTLDLTSAGAVNLTGVAKFGTVNLSAGNNTVTVANLTLSGGAVTINARATTGTNSIKAGGATAASKGKILSYITHTGSGSFVAGSENDVIDASRDTKASLGKTFTFTAGSGTAKFTGGLENDVVNANAAAVGRDTLTGGSGKNTLNLASAGTIKLARVSKFATVNLAIGNNIVTVAANTLRGGAVTINARASGTNKIDASSVTAAGTTLKYITRTGSGSFVAGSENDVIDASKAGASSQGKTFTFTAGSGTATFIGGLENDVVKATAGAVGRDTLTGGAGRNTLQLRTAGTVKLTRVTGFRAIHLAAGNNTVTWTDRTLSGGAVMITAGATGNNLLSATRETAASAGKTLTYVAAGGADKFTGGLENDVVTLSAAAIGRDTLAGGSGVNTIDLTSPGTLGIAKVNGFGTYLLASGGPNNLSLQNGNFAGLAGALIMVFGGNNGNTLSGAALAARNAAVLDGGSAADTLIAGRNEVLVGGAGADQFRLTTPGTAASPDTNTIADFTHNLDTVAFSEKGFDLGKNPVAATLFTANPTGSFTTPTQRFAYNTRTGALFFGAQGSAGSSREIATLSAHPTLTAADITFVA